jgi:SAM-dependent methyltransferase
MEIDFKNLRVSADYPVYPPYHTGKYLEEYFYNYYIQNKQLFDETDYTLIPAFWTNIYNTNNNRHIVQTYLNALPENQKYFTVSQHDDAILEQLPNHTIQFSAGGLNGQIPIPLICSSIPEELIPKDIKKDILCSFVGTVLSTSEIRNNLYKELKNKQGFYFTEKTYWSPTITENKLKEFIDITQRSWFTLCPRGYGLQSFRLYEALQLGSIPIFVYDTEWFPFDDIIDWSTFCLQVHKNDIAKIPDLINNISEDKRINLIKNGQIIYKNYFNLDKTCEYILKYLQQYKEIKTLSEIMSENKSDKSSNHHNYTTVYSRLFHRLRNKDITLFELGLGTNNIDIPSTMGPEGVPGASLRGWKEYFNSSKIYGGDIDKNILFTEKNIETFYVDQTSPESINELWLNESIKDINFDIIIDDGLHEFDANICFLKNSFHKLKRGGIYIIEDIVTPSLISFQKELEQLKTALDFSYEIKNIYNRYNTWDNIIAIIYKH